MKNFKKQSLMLFFFILLIFASLSLTSAQEENSKLTVYFFWGEDCPHCNTQKPYLEEWENKYPEIEVLMFETWKEPQNYAYFQEVASAHGVQARGVPATFIGERHWIGFSSSIANDIESYIENCLEQGCNDLVKDLDKDDEFNEGWNYSNKQCIHLFVDGGCPQCQRVYKQLENLEEKYQIEIFKYEINNEKNKEFFNKLKEHYNLGINLFPTVFIGDTYIVGEEPILKAIEPEIKKCIEEGCPCPISKVKSYTPITPKPKDVTPGEKQVVNFLGHEIDVGTMPLFFSTFLISFVDGFNPCSLFVLMFLLSIVVLTKSRKKIFAIGFTYLAVAGLAYGLFILMVFNVFLYVGYLEWIKILVATVAFIFALVNIKDFFWYKKWISFTIPDSYKPKIFKKVRNLMKHDGSFFGLIFGSALLALGITLVELPCTAGLPWIWSSLIAQYELSFVHHAFLFLTYIFVYFSIELVIFLIAVFTLQISKFQERHGRTLKLIGGLIMGMLGFVLLYDHTLMEDLGTTMALFFGTIVFGVFIAWIYSKKFGFKRDRAKLENKKEDSEEKPKEESKDLEKRESSEKKDVNVEKPKEESKDLEGEESFKDNNLDEKEGKENGRI